MSIYKNIENLITDRRFQELKYKQENASVFSVVGQTHTEHWHSAFYSWLLDPNSSLQLGHFPLARLLNLYLIKNDEPVFNFKDIYCWDLNDIHFVTEKDASAKGKKRHIDVYGESDELIIVIENKVNAKENFNKSETGQTQDYYDYVESHKKTGQTALYFFFTPDIKQEPFASMYQQITYQELYDSVISKCLEHPQLNKNGRYLLEQYAANLRNTVQGSKSPMALTNIDLCKDLYDNYSELLDEIYNTVNGSANISDSDEPECIVYHRYQGVFDEIYLSVDEKYGRTPKAAIERTVVSLTELYKRGLITDGMRFTMQYDGVTYLSQAVVSKKKCYLMLLDENGKPYIDEKGKTMGVHESSSSAGVDAINYYRKKHGITSLIKTLRGTTYWLNEDGLSIKDLIERM